MWLKISKRIYKGKEYVSKLISHSYKENGKTKHKTLANVSCLGDYETEILKKILKGEKLYNIKKDIDLKSAKSFGHYYLIYQIIKQIGLYDMLDKKYKNEIITMIINKIIDSRSKRNIAKSWYKTSSLEYILHQKEIDLNKLYKSLEYLTDNQQKIENKLFEKRENKPQLILYDITSTYFEGTKCKLAKYGKDRDGNSKWKKIIVLGLLTDEQGLPISIEVFKGNTTDTKTMKKKIIELKKRFGIDKLTLVIDRGMNIECNLGRLNKWIDGGKVKKEDLEEHKQLKEDLEGLDLKGIDYITALKKTEIRKLIKEKKITLNDVTLFNKEMEVEIKDEAKGKRYVCTKNPLLVEKDKNVRERNLEKTKDAFKKIENSIKNGKTKTRDELLKKIGYRSKKWGVEKLFEIKIEKNKVSFTYKKNKEAIDKISKFDGIYVIVTTLMDKKISKEDIVRIYREKDTVEKAFEIMKDDLDVRPIYLRNKKRVKGHIFMSFLALYIEKYMKIKLKDIIKKVYWREIIDELKTFGIVDQRINIGKETIKIINFTQNTPMQKIIYDKFGLDIGKITPDGI